MKIFFLQKLILVVMATLFFGFFKGVGLEKISKNRSFSKKYFLRPWVFAKHVLFIC